MALSSNISQNYTFFYKTEKKPLLSTKLRLKNRGFVKPETFDSQFFSNAISDRTFYNVLRLRSQLTTPTPMPPNRIAPGAGIG